ncbi:nitrile hydratase accessory protein [Granulosicoccus sp. 3-233]|uniref:nitrile hydratase accessory protein n=1 Tax=Granulosicoccus sp. 3-233 TaxID=3417969 RepID=UPI003D3490CD
MFTRFEHYAATSMMGSSEEAPPREDGHLQFDRDWEKLVFGVAIALSKEGHYEWDEFRQALMNNIRSWETSHDLDDVSWDYYQCWMDALEQVVVKAGILEAGEIESRFSGLLDCKRGSDGHESGMNELSGISGTALS